MYTLKFQLAGLPKIISNGGHGNWRVKAARVRAMKHSVLLAVGIKKPKTPLTKARIVFTRHSSLEPDPDNLIISFKSCMDGLKLAGVIIDDRRINIGTSQYKWIYAPKNKGFITVEVYEEIDEKNPAHKNEICNR